MADKQVRYVLGGDSSDFTRAVNEAERRLRASFKGMQQASDTGKRKIAGDYDKIAESAKAAGDHIKGIALAAGTALAGGGIAELAKSTADWADETIKASRALGISFEDLQRYQFAAQLSGIETQTFNDALAQLAKNTGDFVRNGVGPAGPALKDLGVSATDATGAIKPMNVLFEEIIHKLAGVKSATEKNSIAMQLFSDQGKELIKLGDNLQQLKDKADQSGIIITAEEAKAAENFNDQLAILSLRIRAKVLPAIVALSQNFGLVEKAAGDVIDNFEEIFKWAVAITTILVARKLTSIAFGLYGISKAAIAAALAIDATTLAVKGFKAALTLGATVVIDLVLDHLMKKFDDTSNSIENAVNKAKKSINSGMRDMSGAVKKGAEDIAQVQKDFNAGLKKLVDGEVKTLDESLKKEQAILQQKEQAFADAQKKTQALVKEFDDALQNLQNTGTGGQLSFLDVSSQVDKAQQALQSGAFKQAIEEAQKAKQLILDYQKLDPSSGLALQFLLKQSKEAAVAASKAIEQQQQAAVEKTKATIEKIQSQLKLIKSITFDFDEVHTLANARDIIGKIENLVSNNPIVVPFQLQDVNKKQSWNDSVGTLQPLPGYATGGHITGPGTGISDSILAYLSNGEYVIKAAAVKRYGKALFDQLNGMRLPAFATGGAVGTSTATRSGTPINLHLDGKTFALSARSSVAEDLRREVNIQQLKTGRKVHF